MPLPTPTQDENQGDFTGRCMADLDKEFPDEAQRRAVCQKQWDEASAPPAARYRHVLQAIREPWAIKREMLDTIVEIIRFRATGGRLSDEEIRARIGAASPPTGRVAGGVQVIPIFGVISHRMNMFADISGGTSTEALAAEL